MTGTANVHGMWLRYDEYRLSGGYFARGTPSATMDVQVEMNMNEETGHAATYPAAEEFGEWAQLMSLQG